MEYTSLRHLTLLDYRLEPLWTYCFGPLGFSSNTKGTSSQSTTPCNWLKGQRGLLNTTSSKVRTHKSGHTEVMVPCEGCTPYPSPHGRRSVFLQLSRLRNDVPLSHTCLQTVTLSRTRGCKLNDFGLLQDVGLGVSGSSNEMF